MRREQSELLWCDRWRVMELEQEARKQDDCLFDCPIKSCGYVFIGCLPIYLEDKLLSASLIEII